MTLDVVEAVRAVGMKVFAHRGPEVLFGEIAIDLREARFWTSC